MKRTPLKRSQKPLRKTPLNSVPSRIKSRPKSFEEIAQRIADGHIMREFFFSIWNKRPHRSEVSGTPIYGEPLTTYFHHILPKEESQYPEAALDEMNIIILTSEEHDQVEKDMYRYEEVNRRREELLLTYGK